MNAASRGSGPHVLRRLNAAAVMAALRMAGPLRVADLMARTGLTRPTVAQALNLLGHAGWIESTAEDADTAPRKGRPAQLVRFRADAGYLVGVDVGPNKAVAIVADLMGRELTEYRADTRTAADGAELISLVSDMVRRALADARIEADQVHAVCVASPGIIDPEHATVNLAPSIPGWASLPLSKELGRIFRCSVRVENDVNLSVLAERWRGIATDVDTLMFVHWGARVGAGILVGGRLHRGGSAAAGEIGFVDLAEDVRAGPPTDGMGPFERMVGAAAIAALGERVGREQPTSALGTLPDGGMDSSAVFRAAAAGDTAALAVVDEIATRFARGLAPALLILDPDLVVIGGGVSRGGPILLDAVRRQLTTRTLVPPRLALSALGDRAGVLGAVRLCLDDIEERLFKPDAFE